VKALVADPAPTSQNHGSGKSQEKGGPKAAFPESL
jgi:hypothetical protein